MALTQRERSQLRAMMQVAVLGKGLDSGRIVTDLDSLEALGVTDNLSSEFAHNEIYWLLNLLNERIIHADEHGIPRDHESSVYRQQLADKLIDVVAWQRDHHGSSVRVGPA